MLKFQLSMFTVNHHSLVKETVLITHEFLTNLLIYLKILVLGLTTLTVLLGKMELTMVVFLYLITGLTRDQREVHTQSLLLVYQLRVIHLQIYRWVQPMISL